MNFFQLGDVSSRKSFLSELHTPARFFDPLFDHKSGHSVTTEQHRPAICGMFGDLQNLHDLSVVKTG
jgi:outer membrane immunogenic protein